MNCANSYILYLLGAGAPSLGSTLNSNKEVSINVGWGVCLILFLGLRMMRGIAQRRKEAVCEELDGP
jgi:hypothetical protein